MVESMCKAGRGIILSPTRSGKSLILSGLFHNVFLNSSKNKIKNILLIVPNLQLVQQMKSDITDYYSKYNRIYNITFKDSNNKVSLDDNEEIEINNEKIFPRELKKGMVLFGKEIKLIKIDETLIEKSPWNVIEFSAAEDKKLKGKSWEFPNENKIIITNSQWLLLHGNLLPHIDMVVCDEVHQSKSGNAITKLIQSIDIPYKFGCTGTLPEDEKDKWAVAGTFGPILRKLTVTELQEKHVLTSIKLQPIEFFHVKKENFRESQYDENGNQVKDPFEIAQKEYQNESMYLGIYKPCNKKIVALAESLVKKYVDWNVLILFDYISQGESLYNLCNTEKKYFIDGSVKVKDRQNIVNTADNSTGNIIIGNTKCIGTGLTLKNIHCIILCIVGQSATKTIQAVGRGMATNNKSTLMLFDIFNNYKYSQKHFKERTEKYQEYYNLKFGKDYQIKKLIIE